MDISFLSEDSVKIKGKQASFVINPKSSLKTQADGVVVFSVEEVQVPDIEGVRVIMHGPGEYEVGGVKISGVANASSTIYYANVDGVITAIGSTDGFKGKELTRDADVAVLFAKSVVDASVIASLNPRVIILYGPAAIDMSKTFGKEAISGNKYSTSKDKLPADTEVVVLS